ncbi:hypothetical protein ACFVZ3_17150 [Kitasatospora purpeofusca]|uniref:hypothetical protein n=1 Tax=Kitasatospora purpeofusca TaxID=67352 RepID=UPI00365239E4|nr:hypothetical protein KPHV_21920 [Kitasatospora purpeofusca]
MTPSERAAGPASHRSRIPLICPRCGKEQRVVPGGAGRAVKVVHAGTGQEACEPGDLARAPENGTS